MTYNPFSLANKKILITGASSGIGRSVAIECSKLGADVFISGRNAERLNETYALLAKGNNGQITADLNSPEDLAFLVNKITAIDGIVHCAGIFGHKPFTFLQKTDFAEMFDINFFAPAQMTIELLKQKKISKNGSIVFITSISGILTSYYGGALYSSTKGALNGLIKGMALDLSAKKIRVNSVMPAMVTTDIMSNGAVTDEQINADIKKYPLSRYGKPEEVAYAVVYLLSDASSWVTGSNILLDGGRTIAY
ncbi:SDR family oxidoreductase [Mucilaginibacter mali]|uniref:SDR family oxidoreductase n=1 Tax=Mucilaginibacter mali TaxID=2740462 RepID=A0A7D4TLN1_9SPHI|nr:SDR family oxidoreductase [Mucilaginibacter mali]QKJ29393.1 SDR family oxidoreductase [Mucilaginibacter mali]